MKNKKSEDIKLRSKMGWSLVWIIPNVLFLFGLFLMTILGGEYWVSLFLFIALFFCTNLPYRKIRFFAEEYFCLFNIFHGFKKHAYSEIRKIEPTLIEGNPMCFRVLFEEKNVLKTVTFDTGSHKYMADILSFLKDKVEDGVIKEDSFKKTGFEYENGKYRYSVYVARRANALK